jgi:DnaK suppressor protein
MDAQANYSEMMDGAQAALVHANTEALRSLLTETRAEIVHALDRIATGDYGSCEDCSRPIPSDRLRILPAATR